MDDRIDLIKAIGEDAFFADEHYQHLWDKTLPDCYQYVFSVFMEIYNYSGQDGVTFRAIHEYCMVRHEVLSQYDVDIILKCAYWASVEIRRLEDEEE